MPTMLPIDDNNYPIQVLRFAPGKAHTLAVTATSARNAAAFDAATRVIGLYATVPVFIRLGSSSVTATNADHYIPADTLIDIAIAGDNEQSFTHLAAVRASSDGSVYISEKY